MFQDEELSAKWNCHRVPSSPLLTDIDMISLPLSIWLAFTLYYQIIRKYVFFFFCTNIFWKWDFSSCLTGFESSCRKSDEGGSCLFVSTCSRVLLATFNKLNLHLCLSCLQPISDFIKFSKLLIEIRLNSVSLS